jgi:hypothetical protein
MKNATVTAVGYQEVATLRIESAGKISVAKKQLDTIFH